MINSCMKALLISLCAVSMAHSQTTLKDGYYTQQKYRVIFKDNYVLKVTGSQAEFVKISCYKHTDYSFSYEPFEGSDRSIMKIATPLKMKLVMDSSGNYNLVTGDSIAGSILVKNKKIKLQGRTKLKLRYDPGFSDVKMNEYKNRAAVSYISGKPAEFVIGKDGETESCTRKKNYYISSQLWSYERFGKADENGGYALPFDDYLNILKQRVQDLENEYAKNHTCQD